MSLSHVYLVKCEITSIKSSRRKLYNMLYFMKFIYLINYDSKFHNSTLASTDPLMLTFY